MKEISSIGIIGHGKFGKLLEEMLKKAIPSPMVKIYSRNKVSDSKRFFSFKETVESDLIIPVVPIHAFASVVEKISKIMKSDSIIMDICSVKVHPVKVMKKLCPPTATIVASHPLFGPLSYKVNHHGLVPSLLKEGNVVMSFIRGEKSNYELIKILFQKIGIKIIEMAPEDHDKKMAKSQLFAHLVAGTFKKLKFTRTPVDTKSVEKLHDFTDMIEWDESFFKDITRYNSYGKEALKKFHESISVIINQTKNK